MTPKPKNRIAGANKNWQAHFGEIAKKNSKAHGFLNKRGNPEALRNSGLFTAEEISELEGKKKNFLEERRP